MKRHGRLVIHDMDDETSMGIREDAKLPIAIDAASRSRFERKLSFRAMIDQRAESLTATFQQRRWIHGITLIALFLALSGCGLSAAQRSAIAKFATASTALGDLAAQEYAAARTDNILLRTGMAEMH